jgi:hypothetical protein
VGAQNADNLRRTMRSDGVLVKPDAPLTPTDATYLADAQGLASAMVAATSTQHGPTRELYVFAYTRGAQSQIASFTPSALGLDGPAYVYAVDSGSGTRLEPGAAFSSSVAGSAYFVVAPIGPSGIAFLGDSGRFVPLGRARVSQLDDDGVLHATVEFATGEGVLTLRGYAPQEPGIQARGGSVSGLVYDAATGMFTFGLAADVGRSSVGVDIGPVP